jgi:hypothetical protein
MGLEPYSGADGNGDGTTGPEDYQVWVDHFGQTVPQGSGAGSQGSGSGEPAEGGQSPFSATLVVNLTQYAKMGTDPDASTAAVPLASAATPNQGGKAEGGGRNEEGRTENDELSVGRTWIFGSVPHDRVSAPHLARPRRDTAIETSVATARDAGLLAYLASRHATKPRAGGDDVATDAADRADKDPTREPVLTAVDDAFDQLFVPAL